MIDDTEAIKRAEWMNPWYDHVKNNRPWKIPAKVVQYRELMDSLNENREWNPKELWHYAVVEVAVDIIYTRIHYDELKPARRRKRYEITNHYEYLFIQIGRRDGFGCAHCGDPSKDLCIDHVTPLIAGGTNDLDNLQLLCRPCNSKKSGRFVESADD